MNKYTVAKVEGGWGVVNPTTGKTIAIESTRDKARAKKKELELAPIGNVAAVAEAAPTAAVAVEAGEKINKVTEANYAANMARAQALKAKLRAHVDSTGGFPSHKTIQMDWGFNISLKALCRHKKILATELGLKKPTTTTIHKKD